MSLDYEKPEENEPQITPEEFLRDQKSSIRKRAFWAIGIGAFIVAAHLVWLTIFSVTGLKPDFSVLFRSIFFILGLFAFAAGIWGIYYAKNLTIKDFIASPEAVEYLEQARHTKLYYTYILVGLLVVVYLVQMAADSGNGRDSEKLPLSIELAGFVKPLFRQGEYWRILTGGALHGMILHLYFNAQALYGFGSSIEFLANRAHLAIVFVLAIIGGGFLSLVFMPETISIGASGGIMGLVGYLAIFGYRRKTQLPPDFLKSMLINVGFIAAFGVIAYQIVDNFAHLGGLLTGAIYGFVQIPRDSTENPRNVGTIANISGLIALGIFIATCIFSILLLLRLI